MPYFKTENSNAENIKYDNTKSVKEAIDDIKNNQAASSVTFNNANTSLNATNVQDAVTEVNGKLDIKNKIITCMVTSDPDSPLGYYGTASKADCGLSDNDKIISISGYSKVGYPAIVSHQVSPSELIGITSGSPEYAYIHIRYITL